MIRVHVICEGQTEEMFVNEVLNPFFHLSNMILIPALLGKPGHKGGNIRFERLLPDLRNRLRGDTKAYCTTLLDFYGLPSDFPGKVDAIHRLDISDKAQAVCNAMAIQVGDSIGDEYLRRFIPYVQMYEFEALLFSDASYFEKWFNPSVSSQLQHERQQFLTPEHINDNPLTAPSKRILQRCEEYEKPLHGSLLATSIGLETIRRECRLFDQWLDRLLNLTPLI